MASILDYATPVHPYPQGSWGPQEADRFIEGNGGWHNLGSRGPELDCR